MDEAEYAARQIAAHEATMAFARTRVLLTETLWNALGDALDAAEVCERDQSLACLGVVIERLKTARGAIRKRVAEMDREGVL